MKGSAIPKRPWLNEWPSEELESVNVCPVCNSSNRNLVYDDLIDNVFLVAAGKWKMWRCRSCDTAYLSPRPTVRSIGRAYENYYTHDREVEEVGPDSLTWKGRIKRHFVNSYSNWKFQAGNARQKITIGLIFGFFIPGLYQKVLRDYRHLKRLPKGGGLLLDVGCGDASFLELVREHGWSVIGLDTDPKVVENAQKRQLSVYQGGIEYFSGQGAMFDVITLSHVIEHVHDPVKLLADCYRLLKPEGEVWVETPNIESIGFRLFGKNWRGIESPRHLVLFNHDSMRAALKIAGFNNFRRLKSPSPYSNIFRRSYIISSGGDPYKSEFRPTARVYLIYFVSRVFSALFASRSEFITVKAIKE